MEQWQRLSPLWKATLNWQPTEQNFQQFNRLYQEILDGNRKFNLTRITEPLDFWEKHLWDSLAPIFYSPKLLSLNQLRAIDIGTGAGFPAIPLAIIFPQWQLTLLDSTRKKIRFIDELSNKLGIDNVKTIIDRAENLGQSKYYRNGYDVVLIRAVAEASVCAEYALPLLKIGGIALLYRGQWTEQEEVTLSQALEQLGGKMVNKEAFTTPLSQSVRHCLYLKKIKKTPAKFPRDVGIPTQKPL
ncbi:MAG: 16S rRNA (guanine(527)-N(7))-methyltransferase RsmG [Microcystaceae cyanobacterium]